MTVFPTYSVAVQGGSLTVHDLSHGDVRADAPAVLLLHGITANAYTWAEVAGALALRCGSGRVRVLAADLRGRADSRDVVEPAGLHAHAQDVGDISSAFGARLLLVGHSMGGFVGALAAAQFPGRVAGLILVDGGLSLPLPDGVDPDQAIDAVVGPAITRLSMTFADLPDYLEFWADHPAVGPLLAGPHAAAVRAYLAHDLVPGDDGGFVSSCREAVVRADGRDTMVDPTVPRAVGAAVAAGVDTELIWVTRGLLNQSPGLYDEQRLEQLDPPTALRTTTVDTNHYAVLFDKPGVDAIVGAICAQLPIS